jgi:hypothetical protein
LKALVPSTIFFEKKTPMFDQQLNKLLLNRKRFQEHFKYMTYDPELTSNKQYMSHYFKFSSIVFVNVLQLQINSDITLLDRPSCSTE